MLWEGGVGVGGSVGLCVCVCGGVGGGVWVWGADYNHPHSDTNPAGESDFRNTLSQPIRQGARLESDS